jgi:dTDP-4-dehydrorhamnose 3,5-epimerase
MKIHKLEIPDLLIFEPRVFGDERGYFFETWNNKTAKELGIDFYPVQHNESSSSYGVVRGLHYQLNPVSQAKLVRIVFGEVLDVAVDLRKGSPTYGKHHAVVLSAENKKQFFIPKGFAHGFSVLSEHAIFSYMCDDYYTPQAERGIAYNDPKLNIDWRIPSERIIVSDKDKNNPVFDCAEMNF